MPLVALGVLGAVGSVAGGAIASHGAGQAADTQASAAVQAANIQAQSAQQALQFQRDQFNTQQNNLAPWLSTGRSSLANLGYLMGITPAGTNLTPPSPTNIGAAQPDLGSQALDMPSTPVGVLNADRADLPEGSPAMLPAGNLGNPGRPAPGPNGVQVDPNAGNISNLVNPNIGAFGSLAQPFGEKFEAPTGATEVNDPGYQFRLSEGMKALEHSAAAKGDLLNGGTAKAEQQFGQDYASNEYGNVYNRAMSEYLNRFNIFNSNNTNTFNRFSALAGGGQQANTTLANAGENFANNASNITINAGNAQASGINNAAAARASGYVGGANAWTGALGGASSSLSQLALLNQIYGRGSGSGTLNLGPAPTPTTTEFPWSIDG